MTRTAHAQHEDLPIQPQRSMYNFWYADFDGTCIAIGDTREDVVNQILLFLGRI